VTVVFVEAPARLHFGLLDRGASLGRRFGGLGAAVPTPSVLVSATRAATLVVEADSGVTARSADRADGIAEAVPVARSAAQRFLEHYGVVEGARLIVHRVIPAHQGLGSGTQLALATARAMAELYDLPREATDLAHAVGRARRSAIGTYVFGRGGFILEGGRRDGEGQPAPLVARLPIPPGWRCVLVLPASRPGLSGAAESAAFAALPKPPVREAERVAHLTLMALLPALVECDFEAFGKALTEIQRINGAWFAAAQGGLYAPGPSAALIEAMTTWGATGIGQSSWGPAVYALARDAAAGAALANRARALLAAGPSPQGTVWEGGFSHTGARVWEGGD
jgi:beta-ribofuranosylaminobenzene 5'-phosphate synthase